MVGKPLYNIKMMRGFLSKLTATVINGNKSLVSKCIRPQKFFFSTFPTSTDSTDSGEVEGIKKALEVDNERRGLANQDGHLKSERRMIIGFTCKKCSHRTHRTMSHHAYTHGIVLIECSGCQSRHLIADNLGWFKDTPNAARRIEDMTVEVGEIRRSLKLREEDSEGLIELLK